jgi:Skp family chaperone for outer membrane proteins
MGTMRQLLQELQNMNWWGRLFGWGRIRRMLLEASAEWEASQTAAAQAGQAVQTLQTDKTVAVQEGLMAQNRVIELQRGKDKVDTEFSAARQEIQRLNTELAALTQADQQRRIDLQTNLTSLAQLKDRIAEERLQEHQARQEELERKQQRLRQTWQTHQEHVRNRIRQIAERYTLTVVDKFPLKGEPDNVLSICEQFVVLDAKSPGGDDLGNFASYLKTQADSASKYTKQEGVFGQLFFVIPSNTLEALSQTVFRFVDYTVYVIPLEALEPVILSLVKVDEFMNVKEISPEDRRNLFVILGRFAHLLKRRLQVDQFFANESLALATETENRLPEDMRKEVADIEKSIRLNPPQERSSKEIGLGGLASQHKKIEKGLRERGVLPESENLASGLNELPLYSPDEEG